MNTLSIFDKQLPNKSLYNALKSVYGINYTLSKHICNQLGYNSNKKINQFDKEQLLILKSFIETHYKNKIGITLLKHKKDNIQNLIIMKHYKGLRHNRKLPVRGQQTRSNARTQKRIFF